MRGSGKTREIYFPRDPADVLLSFRGLPYPDQPDFSVFSVPAFLRYTNDESRCDQSLVCDSPVSGSCPPTVSPPPMIESNQDQRASHLLSIV